jgi:hypothetical protein
VPPARKQGAARWSDIVIAPYTVSPRDVYLDAREFCQLVRISKLAHAYSASTNSARAAAFAYAQASYKAVFRAAGEGRLPGRARSALSRS